MLQHFWSDESGAITVDWVVISAAVVGLGVASVGAVRTGTGNLGESIRAALSTNVASLQWAFANELVRFDFADGVFTGWSRSDTFDWGEWGVGLGRFASDTMDNPLTFDVSLSDGASNALIEFDLIIGDSWDGAAGPDNPWTRPEGDVLQFQVNGQTISAEPFVMRENHPGYQPGMFEERTSSVTIDGTTYNLRLQPTDLPTQNMGGGSWNDQRWRVSMEAIDAPQNFTLGYSAITSQAAHNESFSIANFSIHEN